MSSIAQITANRENGKLSHGAITSDGKIASRMNAVKHGLTGALVLLPTDDLETYQKSVNVAFDRYKPVTEAEKQIIQFVADHEWKLARSFVMESAILARGRRANQHILNDESIPLEEREFLLEGEVQDQYSKTLTNLTMQQARTQRILERKVAEFEKLRNERELVTKPKADAAMNSIKGKDTLPLATVGVDFSLKFLIARLAYLHYNSGADVNIFDRAWGDPKAKTPAQAA
jgi:hypothetical protein